MEWRDEGLIIGVRRHGEASTIVEALTRDVGRAPGRDAVTFHDPCYLGRYRNIYDEPREVIERADTVLEAPRSKERSFCCGAGGGMVFLGEEKGKRVSIERAEELAATGASI